MISQDIVKELLKYKSTVQNKEKSPGRKKQKQNISGEDIEYV
jgi:hypothetical protein